MALKVCRPLLKTILIGTKNVLILGFERFFGYIFYKFKKILQNRANPKKKFQNILFLLVYRLYYHYYYYYTINIIIVRELSILLLYCYTIVKDIPPLDDTKIVHTYYSRYSPKNIQI